MDCFAGPLCYDFSRLDEYLAQPAVRKQLGVGDCPWQSCNPDVYNDFLVREQHAVASERCARLQAISDAVLTTWGPLMGSSSTVFVCPVQGDIMRNYEDLISEQLEAGIETRIYVGVGG